MKEQVVVCDIGHIPYEPAWNLQKSLQKRLIDAHMAEGPSPPPHVFLLVEHPPVYTLGKNGKAEHLLLSEEHLRQRGASFFHIDRGGDITFHGPGQLVGYPILDLNRFFTDLHRYLRTLEEVIIRTCAEYGLTCYRIPKRTGVWTGPVGSERKICAMGIRTSRWVTMHGFAFNLNTDLTYFSYIIPCGITDRGVTSLAQELGHPVDEAEVKRRVVKHFATLFTADVKYLTEKEAWEFLETHYFIQTKNS